jgi:hypothetical protein
MSKNKPTKHKVKKIDPNIGSTDIKNCLKHGFVTGVPWTPNAFMKKVWGTMTVIKVKLCTINDIFLRTVSWVRGQ